MPRCAMCGKDLGDLAVVCSRCRDKIKRGRAKRIDDIESSLKEGMEKRGYVVNDVSFGHGGEAILDITKNGQHYHLYWG